PLYLAEQHATPAQIGLFFSVLALGRLGVGLIGGWLADTYGHLRALLLGSLVGVFAFPLLLTFTQTWRWTLAGMSLLYFAGALTTPAQAAFVGRYVQQGRGKAFGLMNTVQALAQTAAPALGGWLVAKAGFITLFWVSGACYTGAMLIRMALWRAIPDAPPARQARQSFGQAFTTLRLIIIAGGLVTWMLAWDACDDIARALLEVYQPLYLNAVGLSIAQIGLIGSLASAAMLVSPTLAGWLVDRYGPKVPLSLASSLAGVATLLFIFARTFRGFALAWSATGLTAGLSMTAFDTLISQAVPEQQRGLAYGLFQTAQGLFALPVPLLGAWLYTGAPHAPFLGAGVALGIGAWIAWRKFPARHVEETIAAPEIWQQPA
ncbi:MAG TPA: MFS transporter, partial [Anaerolineales bacterium]|nr:MFS transporter [Anaerolineales bacterium]